MRPTLLSVCLAAIVSVGATDGNATAMSDVVAAAAQVAVELEQLERSRQDEERLPPNALDTTRSVAVASRRHGSPRHDIRASPPVATGRVPLPL